MHLFQTWVFETWAFLCKQVFVRKLVFPFKVLVKLILNMSVMFEIVVVQQNVSWYYPIAVAFCLMYLCQEL